MSGGEFERIVDFTPAFDRRDPNPSKDYGIHGVEVRMVLKGPLGATQFVLYTNWQLPHVTKEMHRKTMMGDASDVALRCRYDPSPADLGYHSPRPIYEGQPSRDDCPYVEGGTCYYDGSSLAADGIYKLLLTGGSDAVWAALEERYRELFAPAEARAV